MVALPVARSVTRRPLSTAVAAVAGTLYLAFLITLSDRGGWQGYAAGAGDHTVLMPQGIQWAIPRAFENDWFIRAAPQPHWFFDVLIAFGVRTGTVDVLLFGYWLLGLAAFSLATLLLAQQIARRRSRLLAFAVLSLSGLTPWMLFGTGTSFIGMALPTVLAGSLLYLTFVLLISGRLWTAAVIATVISVVHVQQGSIVAIVLLVTAAYLTWAKKRVPWPLLAGLVGSSGFVLLGLRLRPVAANLSDFVEVCNAVIPYHCAAWSWPWYTKASMIGGLVLAFLSVLAIDRSRRALWSTTIGLVLLGLGLGFSADALSIPVFGELAQAVNVYRLGSVAVPFMLWGMLLPLAVPSFFALPPAGNASWAKGIARWAGWGVAVVLIMLDLGWNTITFASKYPLLAVAVVTGIALVCLAILIWKRAALATTAVLSVVTVLLASSIATGTLTASPHLSWFALAESPKQQWMRAVGEVVPAGATILAPGESADLRLYSERATVVDCKNIPYGGQAWRDWLTRSREIGVCGSPTSYEAFSLDELTQIAGSYHADYAVLTPQMVEALGDDIAAAGWALLLDPIPEMGNLSLFRIAR